MKSSAKSSSITKRWVRGSLLFTLAVVLLAEGIFLWFTINGYYRDARSATYNQLKLLRGQLASSTASVDEKALKLIRVVEQFDQKTQFELMLVRANGSIETTSSGILPLYTELPADIADALRPGGSNLGEYIGKNETGEKVLAVTMLVPNQAARGIVALRLVTSTKEIDRTIRNTAIASIALLSAIILASLISGVYFIRSIVIPLRKVEATAASIAQGNFDNRIDNKFSDEIGSLCKTINHMAEELSNSERMKNEFISSVSHELRTPLTSIKGWAETIGQLEDPSDPNFRRGMAIISGEADRLYEMVEELLDFSRMQGDLALKPELLDLAAEVEDAVLLSERRATGLGVQLLYTAPETPIPVMVDTNRLRQVMVNVLDNAIKYSFSGGAVEIEILQDSDQAFVVVKDEGQGISPEDLAHVKQKFYKGKGAVRGSGIGLAVVDEIMRSHGGDLQMASELAHGTTVTLRLPLYKKHQSEEHHNEQTSQANQY